MREAFLKAWDIFRRALGTTYRESHSIKWTARVAGFYFGGALILSCIVYHVASLFY